MRVDIPLFKAWTLSLARLSHNAIGPHEEEIDEALHTLDTTLADAAQHLPFGRGHRLCLGHGLARTEMTEALQVLATSFPDAHLAESPTYSGSAAATRGPERIQLRLK
ncbi:cytochrome P450 [Rhodococcus sp. USK10]|uniref:cytochrome P450 n=1 Tax=Rhodococcus sp. USK10 TaxID=2789739 RepID=UPI001C5FBBEA|nr:cytochrome P450 [Rhodococcus sp. USK10]QYB07466.1 cytochrome P450 [Rhodococcus sp. USK10]